MKLELDIDIKNGTKVLIYKEIIFHENDNNDQPNNESNQMKKMRFS